MPSSESISHEGIIEELLPGKIIVRILVSSACSSCTSKAMCTLADMTDKLIEANASPELHCVKGERIKVVMKRSLGDKAVLLAYLIPSILLLLSLIVFTKLMNELLAGLITLIILAIYFTGLALLEERLSKTFRFSIEKL